MPSTLPTNAPLPEPEASTNQTEQSPVDRLLNALSDESPDLQFSAIEEIGGLNTGVNQAVFDQFRSLLERIFESGNFNYKYNTPLARAITEVIKNLLSTSAHVLVIENLEACLYAADPSKEGPCRCALEVIGHMPVQEVSPSMRQNLIHFLSHEYHVFRFYAAEAITHLGQSFITPDIRARLADMLSDKSWWSERNTDEVEEGEGEYYVAQAAAMAISKLAGSLEMPLLLDILEKLLLLQEPAKKYNKSLFDTVKSSLNQLINSVNKIELLDVAAKASRTKKGTKKLKIVEYLISTKTVNITEDFLATYINLLIDALNHNLALLAENIIVWLQQYETEQQLRGLNISSIHQPIPPLSTIFYGAEKVLLLKLIDMYLSEIILGRWVIKDRNKVVKTFDNRDEALGGKSKKNSTKINLIKKAIILFRPELINYSDEQLKTYYEQDISLNRRYVSHDPSDDSDSDDERTLATGASARDQNHRRIAVTHADNDFWAKTNRNYTDRRDGSDAAGSLRSKARDERNRNRLPTQLALKDLIKNAKKELKERGTLSTRQNSNKRYIAQFRGVNYMEDRWSVQARRYHYALNEVRQPQFSETILRTLPFDFYTELSEENNFYNAPWRQLLINSAEKLRGDYQTLRQNGYYLAPTIKPSPRPYIFNSKADYLQHAFSNGISLHLLALKALREQDPATWGQIFPNAFNYAIATGDRPYHSLKYAFGLKDYYEYSFEPRYNQDGSIENTHTGKLYIILHEASEFLQDASINRVMQMNYAGQVPVDPLIAPELETSFIGAVPAQRVVYQLPLKFPSFNKPYKNIYEVKYGMDRMLYECFQYFIVNTPIQSAERNLVIELLKEWLCAYYEVLALRVALQEARKDGELYYVNHDNHFVAEPELMPFTNTHIDSQNQVHMLQNFRWYMGQFYASSATIPRQLNINLVENLLSVCAEDGVINYLIAPANAIKIEDVSALRVRIINREITEQQAKRQLAREILNVHRQTFNNTFTHTRLFPVETKEFTVSLRKTLGSAPVPSANIAPSASQSSTTSLRQSAPPAPTKQGGSSLNPAS